MKKDYLDCASLLRPRVELHDVAAEIVAVQVRIDLGGGDAGVAQHFLHGAQIGTAFNQMRGERMPERMRTDLLPHAGLHGKTLHEIEDRYAR